MAVALEDSEVSLPGPDCFSVLISHDAGELMEMVEVVGGPRS